MALALSTMQPFSEVCTWDDRTIDTAWHLVDEARRKEDRDPGAGGPQYSG